MFPISFLKFNNISLGCICHKMLRIHHSVPINDEKMRIKIPFVSTFSHASCEKQRKISTFSAHCDFHFNNISFFSHDENRITIITWARDDTVNKTRAHSESSKAVWPSNKMRKFIIFHDFDTFSSLYDPENKTMLVYVGKIMSSRYYL